jgi:hypothetical protein
MSVRSALHVSVRSALRVLTFVLALVLLVIVIVFGAIFAFAYRNRRPGFSYFSPPGLNAKDEIRSCVVPPRRPF